MSTVESGGPDRPRTALVTGSLGFLGRRLCDRLRRDGVSVIGLDRGDAPASTGLVPGTPADRHLAVDLRDEARVGAILRDTRVTDVFHLAARAEERQAREAPAETFDVNVRGTWNVLDAVRRGGGRPRIVLASTVAAHRARTADPDAVPSPYGVSKACAEMIAASYHENSGLPTGVVRLANLYGPGDLTASRIIPGTILDVLAGERPRITSDGTPVRSFLYVDDAVDALVAMADSLDRAPGALRHLDALPAEGVTVLEIVGRILAHLGREDLRPRILGKGPAEPTVPRARGRNDVGWKPRTELDEGLRRTCRWFREDRTRSTVAGETT